MKKVELLSPAGSYEAFAGALNAGADAFYMGGEKFGARAYADNFSSEALARAIREAHLYGKKVYLTVNTLTRQEELGELTDFVRGLYEQCGLDGVIVQDTGVLQSLSAACPGLLLHASTQMSVATREGAAFLKRLGVSRVVPARELSLDEIRLLKQEDIEIEAFIHGAMCYSYSGRCLMSSFLGGRSGNRGRCAGPCRLPYDVYAPGEEKPLGGERRETYPISMRDLCVLEILPELIDAGIDSFKIEGRMKKPEYAAGVTAVYRKYLDRFYDWNAAGRPGRWQIDSADITMLHALYLRSDLSTGYYKNRNGRELLTMGKPGYSGTPDALLKTIREKYLPDPHPIPVTGFVRLKKNQPAELTLITGEGVSATAYGASPAQAKSRPLTEEEIRTRLSKTGGSVFSLSELSAEIEPDLFMAVSSLNDLRREAVAQLEKAILAAHHPAEPEIAAQTLRASLSEAKSGAFSDLPHPARMVSVTTQEQYDAVLAASAADYVILESEQIRIEDKDGPGKNPHAIRPVHLLGLPYIFRENSRGVLEEYYRMLTSKNESGEAENVYAGVLVRTIEELEFMISRGYTGILAADSSCYAWNQPAAALLLKYCDLVMMPQELSGRELCSTFSKQKASFGIQLYGRIPMMITAGCVRKTMNRCTKKEEGFYLLKDRKGEFFPVRTVCRHCYNIIYNSVPLSLHKDLSDHRSGKNRQPILDLCAAQLLAFTTESGSETRKILRCFKEGGQDAPASYTTGHFRKGAD
ncbi:MAG: U32 family peptidase [Lachnospiraceae bacterium]|nr:U32 family peptidase [Lachnospiraceae bacterium]